MTHARLDTLITDALYALRATRALETSSLGVDRKTREAATAAIARLEERVRGLRYKLLHPCLDGRTESV